MPNALEASAVQHRILNLGDTGSGKTTQLLTFPGKKFAYLFDPNAVLSLRGYDVDYEEFLPDKLNLALHSLAKDKTDKEGKVTKLMGDRPTVHESQLYADWENDFNKRLMEGFFDQ